MPCYKKNVSLQCNLTKYWFFSNLTNKCNRQDVLEWDWLHLHVFQDLGGNVQGGIWLSMLVLAGIKQEVITTYKTLMGALTSAADDFTVYFFVFVVTYLFVWIRQDTRLKFEL